MAEIDNDELEFEALAKCSKALSKLDDDTKKRVIHYLLIKYNLINIGDTFVTSPSSVPVGQPIQLTCKTDITERSLDESEVIDTIPSVYELVTKQYAKSEKDILLLILYKMSNGNQIPINRSEVVEAYRNNNVYSDTRRKNVTANINALIKRSYITAPNSSSYALTPAGIEQVKAIAEGRSTSISKKKQKNIIKK
jgi:hypothetical protein